MVYSFVLIKLSAVLCGVPQPTFAIFLTTDVCIMFPALGLDSPSTLNL